LEKRHTQRAAEGATEAELNRRGISTARTYGNEPGIDFVAIHPNGRLFPVEVKGQRFRNDWYVDPRRQDTTHIFVFVPTNNVDRSGAFRFFVMTSSEVREAMEIYLQDRRARGTSDEKWAPAIRWRDTEPQENRWDKLE
jgi:hypothetical protein